MNILYFFPERNTNMYQWQRIHIFDELERNGHIIHVFNPLNFTTVEEANEQLILFLKKSQLKFDLFMNCASSDLLFKETIEDIKKFGLPTLLICFDNLHAPFIHQRIASSFDLVWLTSKETMGMFKNWGCTKVIFQPYAANPYKFKPHWDKTMYSVSFIGTPYGSRINKLNLLTKYGIKCNVYADILANENKIENLKITETNKLIIKNFIEDISQALSFDIGRKLIFSSLLNKFLLKKESVLKRNNYLIPHSSVSFDDMQKIYSNSSLSLNITELRNTYVLRNPIHKIHLRTFEIPMCGGLEIASYTEELAGYFDDEKEIILYKSEEEFISKAKFHLDPKNERICLEIKQKARKRAESEHTWMNRFQKVFKEF
jgi:spore maturation protein CgeB